MGKQTFKLATVTLTGTDQAVELPDIGDCGSEQLNLISFHFGLSSAAGDNVTVTPEEFYTYKDVNNAEEAFGAAGWGNVAKDDGTGTLTKQVLTAAASAITAFSAHFSTSSTKMRVLVKGQGTLIVHATVAKVS